MLFDLSKESLEVLKGMLGKCLRQIYSVHMDYSLRDNQMTIYEELVWLVKNEYINMKAEEIDTDNDYYSFVITQQELPDPLPYEKDEWGEVNSFMSISSISIWSKISKITIHSLKEPKPEEPPYIAVLLHLENGKLIGLTPNVPIGFNFYFDSSARELVEEASEIHCFTLEDDYHSTLSDSVFLDASIALGGEQIPKSLRAIKVSFDEKQFLCEWTSIYEREPTDYELECQCHMATYYFSEIDQGPMKFSKQFIVKPMDETIEKGDGYLLYHRYEDNYLPPPVRLKEKINLRTIHSTVIESLNGSVTKNLEAVDIAFSSTDLELTWFAKFDSFPDEKDVQLQQLAAERFLSSFGITKEPRVVILNDDDKLPDSFRGIFRQFSVDPE